MPKGVTEKSRVSLHPGFPELSRSDVSIYPSYSNLKLSYVVVCRHRYHYVKVRQYKQLMGELRSFERRKDIALSGVRLHREFSQGVLSHAIPARIIYQDKLTPDPLTKVQRMRLENIINENEY